MKSSLTFVTMVGLDCPLVKLYTLNKENISKGFEQE